MELCHHGVKGQKWGVRRYQNKDGSRTFLGKQHRKGMRFLPLEIGENDYTISSGTSIQRLTTDPNEPLDGRHKYISFLDIDNDIYAKEWKRLESVNGKSYVKTYKAIKDIKVAGAFETLNTILEVHGDRPISKIEFDEAMRKEYADQSKHRISINPALTLEKILENKSGQNVKGNYVAAPGYKTAFKAYNPFSETAEDERWKFLDPKYMDVSTRTAYFKKMSDKGYNAVTDFLDASGLSKMPVILLNPKDTIKETSTKSNTMEYNPGDAKFGYLHLNGQYGYNDFGKTAKKKK